MATKAKTPKYVKCAIKNSVLVGNILIKPQDLPVPSSRLNQAHLQTALSAGLLVDADVQEEEATSSKGASPKAPAKTPRKKKAPTKDKNLPLSANPEDLKDSSLEDLLVRAMDEFEASLPKDKEPDESDYPQIETREDAIKYLSQNFKK